GGGGGGGQRPAEQPAQLGEAQLVPRLAGEARQQRAEIAFAPAATADRDQGEKVASEARAEQLLGAREGLPVERGNARRQARDDGERQSARPRAGLSLRCGLGA